VAGREGNRRKAQEKESDPNSVEPCVDEPDLLAPPFLSQLGWWGRLTGGMRWRLRCKGEISSWWLGEGTGNLEEGRS